MVFGWRWLIVAVLFFSLGSKGIEGSWEVLMWSPSLNTTDDFFVGVDGGLVLSMLAIVVLRSELRLGNFGGE